MLSIFAAWPWRNEHQQSRQRFLCPYCLRFGDYRFACAGCGRQISDCPIIADGDYLSDCVGCEPTLLSCNGADGLGVSAFCTRCGHCCDRAMHHERSVRILATLDSTDFTSLTREIGAVQQVRESILLACHDDGRQLTYIVNIDDAVYSSLTFSSEHVVVNLDSVWLDKAADEPLALGREIDRYIRLSGISKDQLNRLAVCVTQASLDSAARSRLDMLSPSINYSVAAAAFRSTVNERDMAFDPDDHMEVSGQMAERLAQ